MPRRPPPDAVAPDGSLIYFQVTNARTASLVEVVLPAGGISKPVHHRTVEEIWSFTDGEGEVWLRDPATGFEEIRRVEPGHHVVIPTGHHFQFRTTGPTDLRFLCYTAPPWPGDDEAVAVTKGAWPAET